MNRLNINLRNLLNFRNPRNRERPTTPRERAVEPIAKRAEWFCGPSGLALDLPRHARHDPGLTHRGFDAGVP